MLCPKCFSSRESQSRLYVIQLTYTFTSVFWQIFRWETFDAMAFFNCHYTNSLKTLLTQRSYERKRRRRWIPFTPRYAYGTICFILLSRFIILTHTNTDKHTQAHTIIHKHTQAHTVWSCSTHKSEHLSGYVNA